MSDQGLPSLPRITIQAFCESQSVSSFILQIASDRRMMRTHIKVNMGGVDVAVETFRQAPTPNIIIIESTTERAYLVNQLDQLAECCDMGTKVVVIGKSNDIVLYRELRSRGVSEYFVQPLDPVDFISALANLYVDTNVKRIGRIYGFFGARGGVGASTIAHNFAWTLARESTSQVSLIDLDFPFGTAALNLNQDSNSTLGDLQKSFDRVDGNMLDRIFLNCGERFSLAAAPALLDRSYDFSETELDQLIETLRSLVPQVILDIPHMWTSSTRRVLLSCDEVILVATPDLTSLRNARSFFDTMRMARPNDAAPRLILNMTNVPKRPEITIDDFGKALEAANNGQMLAEVDPTIRYFHDIIKTLTGKSETVVPAKKSFLAPLLKRIG
jgi:pilus assembly protein CpaE